MQVTNFQTNKPLIFHRFLLVCFQEGRHKSAIILLLLLVRVVVSWFLQRTPMAGSLYILVLVRLSICQCTWWVKF